MKSESARARSLLAKDAISRDEFDKIEGDCSKQTQRHGARPRLSRRRSSISNTTEIRAPVSGRISRKLVTIGNLVESGEMGAGTLLTTIVSIAPIYAYFDVDEPTYPKIEALVVKHKGKPAPPVEMAVGDERDFPHKGAIDFVDNQVESGTGTMKMRGVFKNDDRFLAPGLFARLGACRSAIRTRRFSCPSARSTPTRGSRSSTSSIATTSSRVAASGWAGRTAAFARSSRGSGRRSGRRRRPAPDPSGGDRRSEARRDADLPGRSARSEQDEDAVRLYFALAPRLCGGEGMG